MFVGMDVHKNYLQVAVLDEKGKVVSNSRVDNNLIKVNEFFDTLHPGNNTEVVMEHLQIYCMLQLIRARPRPVNEL
jgi:hypothetical protein